MKHLAKWSKNHSFLVVLLVLTFATSLYYYSQYQASLTELAALKKNPTVAAQNETADLVAKVGQLVVLPSETPTVATVSDISKLKDQPFFAKAENGDKILIYTQVKKAYLYSVKLNKILDVAPVNIGTQGATKEVAGESTKEEKK